MSKLADILLTPSESNAFDSFLSAMDSYDPNRPASSLGLSAEWTMYSSAFANHVRIPDGKEDLIKATQDLISFGDDRTSSPSSLYTSSSGPGTLASHSTTPTPQALQRLANFSNGLHNNPQSYLQDPRSWPSIPAGTGFQEERPPPAGMTGNDLTRYGISATTARSFLGSNGPRPQLATLATSNSFPAGSSSSPVSSSATPHSLDTPASASPASFHRQPPSRKRPSINLNHSISAAATTTLDSSNKRQKFTPVSYTQEPQSFPSNTVSLTLDSSSGSPPSHQDAIPRPSAKGPARKSSSSSKRAQHASPSSRSSSLPTPPQNQPKPSLLSASQKKLNHIYSEQKRRANIRRGYDALCDVVPTLRDAIRAEDAACVNTGKKRGRGRLLGEDGEKLDGRAGPRSESVVLQKTIEYMEELLGERSSLLDRLHLARSSLSPGHPALDGPSDRPWERIWNGGIGLPLNGEALDDEDDSDEGD